jgi:hypothetical protein
MIGKANEMTEERNSKVQVLAKGEGMCMHKSKNFKTKETWQTQLQTFNHNRRYYQKHQVPQPTRSHKDQQSTSRHAGQLNI